jgi:CheY-like chemotaxis protein
VNKGFKHLLALRLENFALIEQLKLQNAEVDRANLAKSKFLAAASHDLLQPLYSLTLFTSILDESTKDPKTRTIVEQINVSVDVLKDRFETLLALSKLEAGIVAVEKQSFALDDLFKTLAHGFDMQASEKGLSIHWPQQTFKVLSDPRLFEQIFRNYLTNALHYTNEGKITVLCELQNDYVNISISDTGIGIPEEELPAVFTEFHQVGYVEREPGKGLGLGLAIVDRIAKLLEHEISVSSKIGVGSTFSIKVKHADNTKQHEPLLSSQNNQAKEKEPFLVAMVDDEENIREGISGLLALWNYTVVAAGSGEELMTELNRLKQIPDVLITDYRLANQKTGIDVIEMLRTSYQIDIPALIVTGEINKQQLVKMNIENFQLLYKPVPVAQLRTFLRNVKRSKDLLTVIEKKK